MTFYDTVVIKLSGEALSHHLPFNGHAFEDVAEQIADLVKVGVRCGLVVGGGNIFRGNLPWGGRGLAADAKDDLGMHATGLNARALMHQLDALAIDSSIIAKPGPCAHYGQEWNATLFDQSPHAVFIVAGGIGKPGVSTDVAAPMLARDMGANRIIMAKFGVDGIYSGDPNRLDHRGPRPALLPEVAAAEALRLDLQVMDRAAIELCDEIGVSVQVVGAKVPGSIRKAALGEQLGSVLLPTPRLAATK